MKPSIAIAAIVLLVASAGAQAGDVRCHVIYGGEEWIVDAAPTATPYKAANQKIGRYFEFKVVQAELPSVGRFVRVYTYGISTGDAVLIHQASFRPPFDPQPGDWGFTGLQYVYEPSKSSELQYWCRMLP